MGLKEDFSAASQCNLYDDYGVISFNDFIANTGDTEGRIAARRNVQLGNGFSVGDGIDVTAGDTPEEFGVIGGYDVTWGSGRLTPDDLSNTGPTENIFAGSTHTVPDYLEDRVTGDCAGSPGCLDSDFRGLRDCYTALSDSYCAQPNDNIADVKFLYSALFVECTDNTDASITLNLKASDFANFQWISTENCYFGAEWTINIDLDVSDLVIQGDVFPAPNGKVTYNFCHDRTASGDDCDGTVTIKNALNGNILAPNIGIVQAEGVILGKVVTCNFSGDGQVQVNLPDSELPFLIQSVLLDRINGGSTFHVESLSSFIEGDPVVLGGEQNIVSHISESTITFANDVPSSVGKGTVISTTVNPPFSDRYTGRESHSSSSVLTVSFSVIFMTIFALFFL